MKKIRMWERVQNNPPYDYRQRHKFTNQPDDLHIRLVCVDWDRRRYRVVMKRGDWVWESNKHYHLETAKTKAEIWATRPEIYNPAEEG